MWILGEVCVPPRGSAAGWGAGGLRRSIPATGYGAAWNVSLRFDACGGSAKRNPAPSSDWIPLGNLSKWCAVPLCLQSFCISGKESKSAVLFSIPVKEIMPLSAYFSSPGICYCCLVPKVQKKTALTWQNQNSSFSLTRTLRFNLYLLGFEPCMTWCFWRILALDQLTESSGDLLFRMRPQGKVQMEMRVIAVRNGKHKIMEERRKENENGRRGTANTKQQMLEKGQWKKRNSENKYCCLLFLQHHWSLVEHVVPCGMSYFIKTQSNYWTRVTGIQIVFSYINHGLHNRTLLTKNWPLKRTDFSEHF